MLSTLLSAFLKDAVTAVRTEAFFEHPAVARKKLVEECLGAAYPRAMRSYLTEVSVESFVQDVKSLLPLLTSSHGILGHLVDSTQDASVLEYPIDLPSEVVLKSKQQKGDIYAGFSPEFLSDIRAVLQEVTRHSTTAIREHGFIHAFAGALSEEVALVLDGQPVWKESKPTEAAQRLAALVQNHRVDELTNEIQRFLKEQCGIDSPVIQSPMELGLADKQEMRKALLDRYPGSVPSFQVEPSLAGGLRLFYKGELLDESWMTHIARAFAHLRNAR